MENVQKQKVSLDYVRARILSLAASDHLLEVPSCSCGYLTKVDHDVRVCLLPLPRSLVLIFKVDLVCTGRARASVAAIVCQNVRPHPLSLLFFLLGAQEKKGGLGNLFLFSFLPSHPHLLFGS